MRSHLLHGVVRHRRARPFTYGLEHGVFYAALDLDELDEVDRSLRLFRRNGRGSSPSATRTTSSRRPPTSGRGSSTTCGRRARTRAAGGSRSSPTCGWRATSSTRRASSCAAMADGVLRVVVVEVHNTHGERHLYTLRPRDAGAEHLRRRRWTRRSTSRRSSRCAAATRCASGTSPARLRITINQHQPEGLELHASLDLARRPLTDRNLAPAPAPPPVPPPADDGPDPLARPAAVAARRPVPTPSRGRPMTSPTLPVDRAAAPGLLDRLAWRVALAAAERIRIGRLRVVLPDGSVRTFGGDARRRIGGDPDPRPRGVDPHPAAAARPGPARRTWTGCGPARTCRPCSGSRPATARRSRCPAAGSGSRRSSAGRSRTGRGATPAPAAAATSPPTTTWATTSTGCSSTRR